MKDKALRRAGYQCEAVGKDGTRCTCRSGLEIDHRIPFGKGGGHEFENLQVLCRAHNLRKAELDYGIRLIGATGKKHRPHSVHGTSAIHRRVASPVK